MSNDEKRSGGLLRKAVATLIAGLVPAGASALDEGEPSPAFSFPGSDGQNHTLEKLLDGGKQGIVLAFFPKAFTPG
jgi:hypothetical protein